MSDARAAPAAPSVRQDELPGLRRALALLAQFTADDGGIHQHIAGLISDEIDRLEDAAPAPAQADDGARYHVEDLRETAKRVGSHRAATNCLDAAAFIERQAAALAAARAEVAGGILNAEYVALLEEVTAWRECARYDPLMSGRAFKGWDRSGLDRCRRTYIEGRK